jgi:hypothetical protein
VNFIADNLVFYLSLKYIDYFVWTFNGHVVYTLDLVETCQVVPRIMLEGTSNESETLRGHLENNISKEIKTSE